MRVNDTHNGSLFFTRLIKMVVGQIDEGGWLVTGGGIGRQPRTAMSADDG